MSAKVLLNSAIHLLPLTEVTPPLPLQYSPPIPYALISALAHFPPLPTSRSYLSLALGNISQPLLPTLSRSVSFIPTKASSPRLFASIVSAVEHWTPQSLPYTKCEAPTTSTAGQSVCGRAVAATSTKRVERRVGIVEAVRAGRWGTQGSAPRRARRPERAGKAPPQWALRGVSWHYYT